MQNKKVFSFPRGFSPRFTSGFTLIEILLVIVLIGLLGVTALTSYFDTTKTFTFLAEYKPIISTLRNARSYAIHNKKGDVYDTYGIEINSNSLLLFADTNIPFKYDGDPVEEIVDIDPSYKIEYWEEGSPVENAFPVYLYYENMTGELTAYKSSGGNLVLITKKMDKRLDFRFTDGVDLNRYIYIYQVSGIAEESNTPFL